MNNDQSGQKREMTPQERYFSARGAWLFFVLVTAIYLVLGMLGAGWRFPFMSEIVRWITQLGDSWLYDAIGLAATAGFAYMWVLSENKYAVFTVCAVIYLIDSVLALAALVGESIQTMVLLHMVIRLLLAWVMLMGIKAAKLLKMAEEQPMVILEESKAERIEPEAENKEN